MTDGSEEVEAPAQEVPKVEDNTMTYAEYMASKGKKDEVVLRDIKNDFAGISAAAKVEEESFMTMGTGKKKKEKKQKESKKTIDVGFRVVRSLFVMCSLLWIGTIVTQEKFGRRRLCVFFRSQIYVSFRLFLSCRKRPTREARAAVTDETAVAEVVETEETVAAEGAEVVVEEDQAEDPEAVALRNHRASMSKTRAPSPLSKQNCIVCIPLI